jgi:hypothetical protein
MGEPKVYIAITTASSPSSHLEEEGDKDEDAAASVMTTAIPRPPPNSSSASSYSYSSSRSRPHRLRVTMGTLPIMTPASSSASTAHFTALLKTGLSACTTHTITYITHWGYFSRRMQEESEVRTGLSNSSWVAPIPGGMGSDFFVAVAIAIVVVAVIFIVVVVSVVSSTPHLPPPCGRRRLRTT